MNKIKLDLKTILLIITTTCVIAGLYYTMEGRMHSAETELSYVKGQVRTLNAEVKWLKRTVNKIKKEKSR
jgi:outer membrane murein-binding lipoprotein Lpp